MPGTIRWGESDTEGLVRAAIAWGESQALIKLRIRESKRERLDAPAKQSGATGGSDSEVQLRGSRRCSWRRMGLPWTLKAEWEFTRQRSGTKAFQAEAPARC